MNNEFEFIDEAKYHLVDLPPIDATLTKINDFALLEEGWHFGDGEKFDRKTILRARDALQIFKSNFFFETDAFPGFKNDLRITAYRENIYIEFTINDLNDFDFTVEINKQPFIELEFKSLDELEVNLLKLQLFLWNCSSESYRQFITILNEKVLTAWPSEIAPKVLEGGYQSLNTNVRGKIIAKYASTCKQNTNPLGSDLMFFGNSTSSYFLPIK